MSKEEKIIEIFNLFIGVTDLLFIEFFDLDSDKMLDEKIEVLKQLNKGVSPIDIKNYYKVLELYPKDEIWDL